MENAQFTITIMRGFDGGRIIYEAVTDEFGVHENRLVFGGNEDEASRYISDRITRLSGENVVPKDQPRQIDGPVKIRVRRKPEPDPQTIEVLDALETAEDAA